MVPRRLIVTWWEATDEERADILALVDAVKRQLDRELHPDGYNVGFNAGTAAGQTVGHLHVHVIPRYRGDVLDPRGGVRHVIPGKGNYLQPPSEHYVLVDGQVRLLRDDLLGCLRDPRFDRVDLLVSFVMKSGLEQVHGGLVDALDRGAKIRVLTTDYLTVTDADALARLLDWLGWPLSAWAGRLRDASTGWFRIDGRRFVPAFQVADAARIPGRWPGRVCRLIQQERRPAPAGDPLRAHYPAEGHSHCGSPRQPLCI